jgi:hypothetical protein
MKLLFITMFILSCKAKERPTPSVNNEAHGEVVTNGYKPCDIKPEEQRWEIKRGETDLIRLKVCGGWLVKSNHNPHAMFTFYADENHVW